MTRDQTRAVLSTVAHQDRHTRMVAKRILFIPLDDDPKYFCQQLGGWEVKYRKSNLLLHSSRNEVDLVVIWVLCKMFEVRSCGGD